MYFRFKSDTSRTGVGFNLTWDATSIGCGGTIKAWSGHITSPNYPLPYGRNAECYWKVITSVGSIIQIIFYDLDLEGSALCRLDYLEVCKA